MRSEELLEPLLPPVRVRAALITCHCRSFLRMPPSCLVILRITPRTFRGCRSINGDLSAARWLAAKQATKRPSTADLYATELRSHVLPAFASMPLPDTTRRDVRSGSTRWQPPGWQGPGHHRPAAGLPARHVR
jgi:hypothetical protein